MVLALGSTRSSTMEKYVKYLARFLRYIRFLHGVDWPQGVWQVMGFIQSLIDEPAAPSVPQVVLQAVAWIERCGGVSLPVAFGSNGMVNRAIDAAMVALSSGSPALQAPRFPAAVLLALELYFYDVQKPAYLRFIAGTHLVRAWGTLRLSDLQNLGSTALRKVGSMFVAVLMSSKTSGPGKRNKQLPVAVLADISLRGIPWLQSWLDLSHALWRDDVRNFMVPRQPNLGAGSTARLASYQDVSAGTQKLFASMTWPTWTQYVGWELGEVQMHSEFMRNFYSEHSGRTVLPSITAIIEPD